MNQYEFIEFTFIDISKFETFKQIYTYLKDSKGKEDHKSDETWLNLIPSYTIEYFKESEKAKDWELLNLMHFVLNDLDVSLMNLLKKQEGIGRLEYESFGYPYGGPESLIVLLRSFGLKPYKVYEGIAVYKIEWESDIQFIFINESEPNSEMENKIWLKNIFTNIKTSISKIFI